MYNTEYGTVDNSDTISLDDLILGMHYKGERFPEMQIKMVVTYNTGMKISNDAVSELPFELFEKLFIDLNNGKMEDLESIKIFGCGTENDFLILMLQGQKLNTIIELGESILSEQEYEIILFTTGVNLHIKSVYISCQLNDKIIEYKKVY